MGEIVMTVKATHVPSMLISEQPGEAHGCRQAAIDAELEIGRRAADLDVDTFVAFDTRWLVNAGFPINNNPVHEGNYTSHEFPHFIQGLPCDFPGDVPPGRMNGEWTAFLSMLPEYARDCYGKGHMHDTAMLFGALRWDRFAGRAEIVCPYFESSGTGQVVAQFPVSGMPRSAIAH